MTRDRDRAALEAKGLSGPEKFSAEVARLQEALMASPDISAPARRTGQAMSYYINREHFYDTGQLLAWPSVEMLAAHMGALDRTVIRGRKDLLEARIIQAVEKTRSLNTHFVFSRGWADEVITEADERRALLKETWKEAKRTKLSSKSDGPARADQRTDCASTQDSLCSAGGHFVQNERTELSSYLSDNPPEKTFLKTVDACGVAFEEEDALKRSGEIIAEAPITEATDLPEDDLEFLASFDAFWISFPRETLTKIEHMRRADSAAKAYRRALKRGASHDRILASALRYAHACRKQPHRHTMTEREWLDGRHWIGGE